MPQVLSGIVHVLVYFVICATTALTLRVKIKIADEIFRKILHCILLGSLAVWVLTFPNWWTTALSAIIFSLLVYPLLWLAERIKNYSKIVTERKSGELKSSLIVVFFMFALVTTVCWGWLGDKLLVLASIYAWGFGDAAAALVGKYHGRHKIGGKIIRGRKSYEGTFAMFAVSFICVFAILLLRGGLMWHIYAVIAIATAAVSAAVELYTPNGMDTITCPVAAMAIMLPLLQLFGGLSI